MARFETSDGLSLHFEDTGNGTPLLCLPGLTRDARDFDDLLLARPDATRVIALSPRGRGESDWADDPMEYSLPIEARDAIELLDHLRLDKAVFIGTSRGGMLSMFVAATARHRMSGVLLNDIGPELNPAGLARIYDYLGRRPNAQTMEEMAGKLRRDMGAAFPRLMIGDWLRLAKRWFVEGKDGIDLRYDPRLRDAVLSQAEGDAPDLWPLFDALGDLPVAVVRGENSDLLSAATVEKMKARRPELIAGTVPDRGHVPFLDEAEAQHALRSLLSRIAP
jgi:pimeloyl-ACP methyl ester carboxylesterase